MDLQVTRCTKESRDKEWYVWTEVETEIFLGKKICAMLHSKRSCIYVCIRPPIMEKSPTEVSNGEKKPPLRRITFTTMSTLICLH